MRRDRRDSTLVNQAKLIIDKRGGAESVKEDAHELEDILKSDGSLTEKAKEAAAAIREPGAPQARANP